MVDNIIFKIAYIVASYLLGSVVFGYIIAKILKKEGFGKIDRAGTAGAGRLYGFKASVPTFFFDVGKGVAVPLVGKLIGLDMLTIVFATLAVLVGHNWPVFFKFIGGGGIASTIGIGFVLIPKETAIVFAIALAVGYAYKYTLGKKHKVNPNVVGGALGTFLLPVFTYIFYKPISLNELFLCNEPLLLVILFSAIFLIILTKGLILHFAYRNI